MSTNIFLDDNWFIGDGIYATGNVFYEGEFIDPTEMVRLFESTFEDDIQILSKLNGHYSVIIEEDSCIKLISDHVGSYALFYCIEPFVISDNYSKVRKEIGEFAEIPEDRKLEFRMANYVAGSRTLDPRIHKTEPGTIVTIHEDRDIDNERYYIYRNNPDPQPVNDELYSEWKKNLEESFRRLLTLIDGRQILLGLSGGYDSRLVGMMLDRLGYDNVITFTKDTAYDQEVAMEIANIFDYDWFGIERKESHVHAGYESELWLDIIQKLGQSGMYYRWPSSIGMDRELANKAQVGEDTLRLTGHQLFAPGDFTSRRLLSDSSGITDIIDVIYEKHFNKHRFADENIELVKNNIRIYISNISWASAEKPFETVERWYWHERIPNFLIRDSFLREFDVWHPLLDKQIVEFWNKIPQKHRYGKSLYEQWVERLWKETYDTEFIDEISVRRAKRKQQADLIEWLFLSAKYSVLGDIIKNTPLKPLGEQLANYFEDTKDIKKPTDLDYRLAFVDESAFKSTYTGSEHYRYFFIEEILNRSDVV